MLTLIPPIAVISLPVQGERLLTSKIVRPSVRSGRPLITRIEKKEIPMSDSRLKNYALTAGGAAALAATGLAGAEIQKSSGSTPIPEGLGQSGSTELFTINDIRFNASNQHFGSWSVGGSAVAILQGTSGSIYWSMVNADDSIGTGFSGNPSNIYNLMSFFNSSMAHSGGPLELGTGVIVGFSFTDGSVGDTYYGWVAYDLSMSEGRYSFTVNGWAYNDVAGQGIIAGQDQAAGSSAVPGLGGLAALAIGAAGVRSRRQRTVA